MNKLLLLATLLLSGCTSEGASREALEAYGFTHIEFTGYNIFGCGSGDKFHTGFRAKNQNGRAVEGVVCCGLLIKDCTVRF